MGYVITLDTLEDYKWLKGMFDRSLDRLSNPNSPLADSAEIILRVHKAIEEAKQTRERSTESRPERYRYDLCKDHPFSSFARRPQTDCKGCWKAYKNLHPNEYEVARRTFLANQREKKVKS